MKDWKKIRSEWNDVKSRAVVYDLANMQALMKFMSDHFEDALTELAGPLTPMEEWKLKARMSGARAGALPEKYSVEAWANTKLAAEDADEEEDRVVGVEVSSIPTYRLQSPASLKEFFDGGVFFRLLIPGLHSRPTLSQAESWLRVCLAAGHKDLDEVLRIWGNPLGVFEGDAIHVLVGEAAYIGVVKDLTIEGSPDFYYLAGRIENPHQPAKFADRKVSL